MNEADAKRAARIALRARISEHNRQVKLEAWPSAAERKAAAVMKRMRKAERRQAELRIIGG